MKNKKAQIPVIKVLLILLLSSMFLISWILILNHDTTIDQKKIHTQLLTKKILNGNCFSKKYATINLEEFTDENLKTCLGPTKNTQIHLIIKDTKELYYNTKENFETQTNKCFKNSNILCTENKYPITLKTKTKTQIKELTIQTITK